MTDESIVEEIVSKFLHNTCRLRPQLTETAVHAAYCCGVIAIRHPVQDAEADSIPLITGSVAEFYIEPMIPHIGDVDVMLHHSTALAIPPGHPQPTQLPDEFHSYVQVWEIIDSPSPGYVYLELCYLLTECLDDGKYTAVDYDRQMYLLNRFNESETSSIHGPALTAYDELLSCDIVRCVRCLVWPPQAADWPSRRRCYSWPDSATVDSVVYNGCDVVGVAHRQCRQHEWRSKYQWRLSFSRAEIVLINSWTPVQQIVYHLLRDFMKTELLTDSADSSEAGTLSNYHIKTLMLWACELKPRSWWTDDLSLIGICVELWHELAVSLTEARCPHYFISKCHLIDSSLDFEMTRIRLTSISKSWLSSWFVNSYIRRCAKLCPDNVSQLFDDLGITTELQDVVSAIVTNSQVTLEDMYDAFTKAVYDITIFVSYESLTVRLLDCWSSQYGKISSSLPVYLSTVAFLHVARSTERSGLSDELIDVLSVLVGQPISPQRYSSRRSTVMLLRKAVSLMKAVDDRSISRSTVQLIAIELSKAYLYRTLSWEDSDSDSIYCLANVYLAVLYYTTGQYQTAIDHCTLVMRSKDHSQYSARVVQGEILLTSDDDVDIVFGLAVFYQHVRTAALNQQQTVHMYVTMFTTELFAHYLHMKCVSAKTCQQLGDSRHSQSSGYEVQSYVKYITDTQQLFIADVLLWKFAFGFIERIFVSKSPSDGRQHPTKYPSELNTSDLVELLQKSAVQDMTIFRQLQVRDFDSVATIVTTHFEALYAYKHGDYHQCLHLSEQNVYMLLPSCLRDFPVFPKFIQLLDDDIVSLTALKLIVNHQYTDLELSHDFITPLTLSLYLMTQCQLKLRQSLQSLVQVLHYTKVVRNELPVEAILDKLVLKMIARKAVTYITTMMNKK